MNHVARVVVVGAGQAGSQAIHTLRKRGFRGAITLVGDEPHHPYHRPPLSKQYLSGQLARELLLIRTPAFYAEQAVDLRLGRHAVQLDRGGQRLWLDDGSALAYDALLLATGSRPRDLAIPGAKLAGVHTLRTAGDADRIRDRLATARRVAIIGGGYIGLEVAAICRQLELDVTVLEQAERVMKRVVCAPISAFYAAEHGRHGVRIVNDAHVAGIAAHASGGRAGAVFTADGSEFSADLVLIAVGSMPNDALASAAGIECADGIRVDERCRTSDPHVFAAGDCASLPCLRYGRRVRLESVDNAFEQGTCAALNMLGIPSVHDKVPWFWSDQYDLKLFIIGLCHGHDAVVLRGKPEARRFSACYLRDGELIAIDSVNTPKEQMSARKLVAARVRPDRDKLADPEVPLAGCV